MLAQLTSIIGVNHINIENMVNKAKGDLAYTMIDTNSQVDEKALNEVDNIIRVRIIGEWSFFKKCIISLNNLIKSL